MKSVFLDYVIPIAAWVITFISFLVGFIKANKSKKKQMLNSLLPSLIMTAETLFGSKKGEAKLDYVQTQMKLFALENKLKYDANETAARINSIIECTNKVNVNKDNTIPCSIEANECNTQIITND